MTDSLDDTTDCESFSSSLGLYTRRGKARGVALLLWPLISACRLERINFLKGPLTRPRMVGRGDRFEEGEEPGESGGNGSWLVFSYWAYCWACWGVERERMEREVLTLPSCRSRFIRFIVRFFIYIYIYIYILCMCVLQRKKLVRIHTYLHT
jgi:hypothetical protein